jgi:hypothetical protein
MEEPRQAVEVIGVEVRARERDQRVHDPLELALLPLLLSLSPLLHPLSPIVAPLSSPGLRLMQ